MPTEPDPNPQIICSDTEPAAQTAGASSSSAPAHPAASRRNGNIARLPKHIRDKINTMLQDGVTYAAIRASLGHLGQHLDPSNFTQWRKGGYQDWLAEQAFLARIRARQETPADLSSDFDATLVNHAALQLGALHIFEALRDVAPGSLNEKLGGDSMAFARLINSLARASRETMLLQKYREAYTRARAAISELKDPSRQLNETETRAIIRKVDEILGLLPPSESPLAAPKRSEAGSSPEPTPKL
jgi:hypothetical protein